VSDTAMPAWGWISLIIPVVMAIGVIWLAFMALWYGIKYPVRFRNPANGYVETVRLAFLWSLLFGVFYYAFKGLWFAAILSILFLPSWLVLPFLARRMLTNHYLRMGWQQVS